MKISDNGIGIDTNNNDCNENSLGLKLVRMLTEQLNGSVEVEQSGGTSITVSIPHIMSPE